MSMCIWINIEYCKQVKNKYKYVYVPEVSQDVDHYYDLFSIMAGTCGDYGVLYPAKGFPVDASPEVSKMYYGDELAFSHASWLTTEEFKHCLDYYREKLEQNGMESTAIDDLLKNYMRKYRYMKSCDDDGDPARIVFWFF